jgi:hypothetical protein
LSELEVFGLDRLLSGLGGVGVFAVGDGMKQVVVFLFGSAWDGMRMRNKGAFVERFGLFWRVVLRGPSLRSG